MKLSEMSTEQIAACLCKMSTAIEHICVDDATNHAFALLHTKLDGCTKIQKFGRIAGELLPVLLGTHFDDAVTIISAMTQKTENDVKSQNAMETIRDFQGFFDEEFLNFFMSFVERVLKE